MLHLATARGWSRWRHWYREVMKEKRLMERVVRRMLHGKLAKAWTTWQEWVHSRKASQERATYFMKRWLGPNHLDPDVP